MIPGNLRTMLCGAAGTGIRRALSYRERSQDNENQDQRESRQTKDVMGTGRENFERGREQE